MADLIIRGMEMPPKGKSICIEIFGYGGVHKFGECYPCALAYEVETPHGDLIDRDAFRADNGLGKDCENCDRNTRNCNYDICLSRMDVCGWIDDAPIIVPAEGGTDDG